MILNYRKKCLEEENNVNRLKKIKKWLIVRKK